MKALRPYQLDVVHQTLDEWRRNRSVLVQMPTGTGKTHVLAVLVNEQLKIKNEKLEGGAVWIVAHRRELVEQIEETVRLFVMHNSQCIMHNRPAQEFVSQSLMHDAQCIMHNRPARKFVSQSLMHDAQCIMHNEQLTINNDGASVVGDVPVRVYSIQWLSRHWGDVGNERPGLIVIDEAHHALAETYKELWRRYPEARFLGMTATPCRLNRRGFTDLFDTLVTADGVAEFIRQGWLSAFDYVSIRTGSEEQRLISSLKKRGADGDYQVKEMDAVLNRRPGIGRLYDSVRQYADGRKGIVYAISISHARNIAEYYNNKGINAVAIDSKTPAKERKRLVDDFRQGGIQVLVNVDVFSEGFDCPDVEFIQLARPTLSLAKYLQQVGRGLRRTETKETCVIIDNVGLYRLFGLPTAYRDWQAMFEGRLAGKGCPAATERATAYMAASDVETERVNGNGLLETILSHEQLIEYLRNDALPSDDFQTSELKPFKDRQSGLWGLRQGQTVTVKAQYLMVFDVKDSIAAVMFDDNRCGMVDVNGNVLMTFGRCCRMKFMPDDIMAVTDNAGRTSYIDLRNGSRYDEKPKVLKLGQIDLLKVGGAYYSRTGKVYKSRPGMNDFDIVQRGFYLRIYDGFSRSNKFRHVDTFVSQDSVCILANDDDRCYWFCGELADGSIVVADEKGCYYHVTDGMEKRYVACEQPKVKEEDFDAVVSRLKAEAEARAAKMREDSRREKEQKRMERLAGLQNVVPFRSGLKWGLEAGGRIIVPPVYRNIQAPIGNYCAVEVNPKQWGIIMLDGKVVVEAKYSKVEIGRDGTARLTIIPGTVKTVTLGT